MDPNQVLRLIEEAAVKAVNDLKQLFTEEAFWDDGKINQREYGKRLQHVVRHLPASKQAIETSRADVVLSIEAPILFNMLADTDIWKELFSIPVSYANTIAVVGQGVKVVEEGHVMSPLMVPRRFIVIRSSEVVEVGKWVVADVSATTPNSYNILETSGFYRRPSGCLIEALPDKRSRVTWIHNVELRSIGPKYLEFRDVGSGYGAKRWVDSLEWMLERRRIASTLTLPGVLPTEQQGRNIMLFGTRLLQSAFYGKLNHKPDDLLPGGIIYYNHYPVGTMAESFLSTAVHPHEAFDYLINNRQQWDPFYQDGTGRYDTVRTVRGSKVRNSTTILRNNSDMNMLIQECYFDDLGGVIVCSPLDLTRDVTAFEPHHASFGIIISGNGMGDERTLITLVTHADLGEVEGSRMKWLTDLEISYRKTRGKIRDMFMLWFMDEEE